jgi:hypothetical protein
MKSACVENETRLCSTGPPSEPLAVRAARMACALERSIRRLVPASDQNLDHLEVQAAGDVQELLRQAIQRDAQAKTDVAPRASPAVNSMADLFAADHGGHICKFTPSGAKSTFASGLSYQSD